MAKKITLQELIDRAKDDLFSPYQGISEGKKIYPVFLVDQVELEVTVDLSYDAEAGLKISIPQVIEGSVTGGQGRVSGHKVKIALSPILTPDQLRDLLEQDKRLMDRIREASLIALRKGAELAGEED